MYNIEIPETIHQLMGMFYRLRLWSDKEMLTFGEFLRKIFYLIYFFSFILSIFCGAYTTDDKDESIFLAVVAILVTVQAYRLWNILWHRNDILSLLNKIGTHSTTDRNEFIQINNSVNALMKFVRFFLLMILFGLVFGIIVFPIRNEKRLFLNIAFPLDRSESDFAFWLAYIFLVGGNFCSASCVVFNTITWYLMLGFSFEYKLLGNKLKHMGEIQTGKSQMKVPKAVKIIAEQKRFSEDLFDSIQTYDKINGVFEEFASFFGNLFFMQFATGSVCICGCVYTLAFSSHENLVRDGVVCIILAYSIFDVFTVMYLGNEIKLSSDALSYSLYESNWIEQTQSCKKCVIILMERFKRPQELIVGKIYPLNLLTFTSILNGAYSMFNILQNLRN